jgi:ferrous iron transport protein A
VAGVTMSTPGLTPQSDLGEVLASTGATEGSIVTLADAMVGQWLVILGYQGGEELSGKLYPLGLAPGDSARVVRRGPLGGALLVEAGGRSIALGRSVARRVLVEASSPNLTTSSTKGEAVDPGPNASGSVPGGHG